MNLHDAIKKELTNKNLTQSDLSRLLKQDRQTVNKHLKKWEKGGIPTITLLKKWCSAIGCDYKKFLKFL